MGPELLAILFFPLIGGAFFKGSSQEDIPLAEKEGEERKSV
jgi:hypothetical protein